VQARGALKCEAPPHAAHGARQPHATARPAGQDPRRGVDSRAPGGRRGSRRRGALGTRLDHRHTTRFPPRHPGGAGQALRGAGEGQLEGRPARGATPATQNPATVHPPDQIADPRSRTRNGRSRAVHHRDRNACVLVRSPKPVATRCQRKLHRAAASVLPQIDGPLAIRPTTSGPRRPRTQQPATRHAGLHVTRREAQRAIEMTD